MERKYNRVANIDEQIKNVSLPFFQWKVLFLVLEETGIQELVDILKSDEEEVSQALDGLVSNQLIELIQEKSDEDSDNIIEPDIDTVEEEVTVEKDVTVEEATVDEQETPAEVEDVDNEIAGEPEIDETIETPEEDVEELLESIQEPEEQELETEEIELDENLEEVEEDLSVPDVEEEVLEETAETEEIVEVEEVVEEEKREIEAEDEGEEDESSDITSFIEELGETESEESKEEPEETEVEVLPEEAQDEDAKEAESAKESKTVMVVDDSIVIRKMVEIALEDDDFSIITSNSGKEGLKLLDDENPQLVILDMTLPDMNGIDLLKTIKASKNIPVIMLSGKDAPQLLENAKNAGADDFLPKPFRDEDLVEKVKSLVK